MRCRDAIRVVIAFAFGAANAVPSAFAAQVNSHMRIASETRSFPGAAGWAAQTPGGRGGKLIRVTNLNADGPGSLREAVDTKGPRIVVFEVAGVIDLAGSSLNITEPYITIAGQTAPSPGITLIRGGINVNGHDVVIRHLRIRPGADGQVHRSGWNVDGLSTSVAHDVIIDHCSFSWATDENMSASGPRFHGATPDQWRKASSYNVTFSYNLASEGLANASHTKGEHSKGALAHDNASNILFYRNIFAHNLERNPLLKGGVRSAVINNLIYDPGTRAVHYNLMALEWGDHPYQNGQLSAIGNVMRGGPSTDGRVPFLMLGGDGDLEYFGRDNIAVDRYGNPLPQFGRYGETRAKLIKKAKPVSWPEGISVLDAREVETHLLAQAGARPWDRDADDIRVLYFIAEGRGKIIDDENEVSAYPKHKEVHADFIEEEWDLHSMERKSGNYPAAMSRASSKRSGK